MIQVLASSWALLLGMLLLMVGNGLQGTLLGVRGGIEGFSTFEMSLVMSAYFLGFLGGSRLAPEMIRRVGHVRVFAALASFISAALILFPSVTEPWAWVALRVAIGFCFSGVYVTAESWLNNAATNETRGQALSLYMIVQMAGIVSAQGLLVLGDPGGFILFIVPSVLVSISFAPILLSVSPTPAFDTTKPMSFRRLLEVSPLGFVGIFLMGGVYSALFGMAAVYGSQAGLSVPQISLFVASIYLGGLMTQFPIGWLSDRMDRRVLILGVALGGASAAALGMAMGGAPAVLLVAFLVRGYSPMKAGLWATVAVAVVSWIKAHTRMGFRDILKALERGALGCLEVVLACACAGIVIGCVTQTGLGLKFSSLVIQASGGNLILSLIFVMVASLILGMGLTTSAAYILTVILAGPVLVDLGVQPLAAHMFVFYYACLSCITPPVALAAFAAAGVAGSKPFPTGFESMRLAIIAYLVPFIFVYHPVLIWQGQWWFILLSFITAVLGCVAIGSALLGYLEIRISLPVRLLLLAIALLLIHPMLTTDAAGVLGLVLIWLYTWSRARRGRQRPEGDPSLTQEPMNVQRS